MSDFTNLQISELMLDMMCAESAIFVLVSAQGDIIKQTSAAKRILKQGEFRPIWEVLSSSAATSLKTVLKTGETIKTIESIDSNMYRLEIRACEYGALLYFMPTENLFQGIPAHTKHEISDAVFKNLMAIEMIKGQTDLDCHLLERLNRIYKNNLRIQRELLHLKILENTPDLLVSMNATLNNLFTICYDILSECRKVLNNKDIEFKLDCQQDFMAVFDKKLITHAILNVLSNAMKAKDVSQIKLSVYQKDDMIYIDVLDNGVGIPRECIEDVGSDHLLYQDTNSLMHDVIHGTASGFGLSVVNKIANVHGGVFKISLPENGGSLMQIIFPNNIQMSDLMVKQTFEIDSMDPMKTELSIFQE